MISDTNSFEYAGNPLQPGRSSFNFDAVEDNAGKRKTRSVRVKHEDAILTRRKREQLTASIQDTIRNFQLVSWMCRKHLDYTTTFYFKAKTEKEDFNKELEAYIDAQSGRRQFHIAKRHPLRRFLRVAEGRKVLDGDFGVLKFGGSSERLRGRDPHDHAIFT